LSDASGEQRSATLDQGGRTCAARRWASDAQAAIIPDALPGRFSVEPSNTCDKNDCSTTQQALEIARAALGNQPPDVAYILSSLAILYQSMRSYTKAEVLYKEALAIRYATLGPKHPNLVKSLSHLAGLYYEMGAYRQAEPLWQQAAEMQQALTGDKHPDLAIILGNQAHLYHAIGAYTQEEPLLPRRSSTIWAWCTIS
jgi:tetratricopeptide (TPR) repeat protein